MAYLISIFRSAYNIISYARLTKYREIVQAYVRYYWWLMYRITVWPDFILTAVAPVGRCWSRSVADAVIPIKTWTVDKVVQWLQCLDPFFSPASMSDPWSPSQQNGIQTAGNSQFPHILAELRIESKRLRSDSTHFKHTRVYEARFCRHSSQIRGWS